MGKRNLDFIKNEYYHIYNRGVDKRKIFMEKNDLFYFFHRLIDLNSKLNFGHENKRRLSKNKERIQNEPKLVSIISYCLLPNHFHLILKEETKNGISIFMQKLGTSYTKFFNKKYERSGSLFQGKFKAKHITGNLSLSTMTAYVSLNYKHHDLPLSNQLVKSSILELLNKEKFDRICDYGDAISEIGNIEKYKSFLKKTELIFIQNRIKDSKKLVLNNINYSELEN